MAEKKTTNSKTKKESTKSKSSSAASKSKNTKTKSTKVTKDSTNASANKEVQKTGTETNKVEKTTSEQLHEQAKAERSNKLTKVFLIALIVGTVLGLLYFYKHVFVAATVNGRPVSRLEVIKEAEMQVGQQSLDTIITRMLVEQEAQRRNIQATPEDIQEQLSTLEQSFADFGTTLEAELANRGMDRKDLEEQIRLQVLLEKLIEERVSVSEQEIDEFLELNEALIPEGTDPQESREQVREQLEQQKINNEAQMFLEELRQEANIVIFATF